MGKFSNIYTLQQTLRADLAGFRFRKPAISITKKKLIILGLIISAFLILAYLFKISINSSGIISGADQRFELPTPKATKVLNQEFTFPLFNSKGEEVSRIKYVLENVELRDQIVVKGQKATSIKGRTFLIVNIKIVNDFEKAIEINTKDYVRLSVGGNESELLAPDIHNDPVTIQAISTKYSRIGFPINDTDTNLKLKVGEINGVKQTIDINF